MDYLKSNPKCSTSGRNYESRIRKGMHLLNRGHGNSILELCESVGAPVLKVGRVANRLKQKQKRKIILK